MAVKFLILTASFALCCAYAQACNAGANTVESWNGGGKDEFKGDSGTDGSWTLELTFSGTVNRFDQWTYPSGSVTRNGNKVTIQGSGRNIDFVYVWGASGGVTSATINGGGCGDDTGSPSPSPTPAPTPSPTPAPTPSPSPSGDVSCSVSNQNSWDNGKGGEETMTAETGTDGAWTMVLTFDGTVNRFDEWTIEPPYGSGTVSSSGNEVTITSSGRNLNNFKYVWGAANGGVVSATINGVDCGYTSGGSSSPSPSPSPSPNPSPSPSPTPPSPAPPSGPGNCAATTAGYTKSTAQPGDRNYDYSEVLEKSILFYEAQRSGPLPDSQRVTWRGDSALGDQPQGGWYDAGDHVKFGFPMAASCTRLAWGALTFYDGYVKAGQVDWMVDSLSWVTDYFIAATTGSGSSLQFVAQIGDGYADHQYWGPPETMTMSRPRQVLSTSSRGSEVTGETAACLAAAAMFYEKAGKTEKAAEALGYAKELFNFAHNYKGTFYGMEPYYKNWSGYDDELCFASAMLYKATGDNDYLDKAKDYFNSVSLPDRFDWDNKGAGCATVLLEMTGDCTYKTWWNQYYSKALGKGFTGKGLLFIDGWGSLRHASNVAENALQMAALGYDEAPLRDFAERQINYALGDAGRSFVVGFGENPPRAPHHRSSSCPNPCTSSGTDPNGNVLYGALVGGPDNNDNYTDDRGSYVHNEVTTDYNAAFQGAVAYMVQAYE